MTTETSITVSHSNLSADTLLQPAPTTLFETEQIPTSYLMRMSDLLPGDSFFERLNGFDPCIVVTQDRIVECMQERGFAHLLPDWDQAYQIMQLSSGQPSDVRKNLNYADLGLAKAGKVTTLEGHLLPVVVTLLEDRTADFHTVLTGALHDAKEDCNIDYMPQLLPLLYEFGKKYPIPVMTSFFLSKGSKLLSKQDRSAEYLHNFRAGQLNATYMLERLAAQNFFNNSVYGKTASDYNPRKIFDAAVEQAYLQGADLETKVFGVKLIERFHSHVGDYLAYQESGKDSQIRASAVNYTHDTLEVMDVMRQRYATRQIPDVLAQWIMRIQRIIGLIQDI